MRQHGAFRLAGCPRGVEQPGDVVSGDIDILELSGIGRQNALVGGMLRRAGWADGDDILRQRDLFLDGGDRLRKLGGDDDGPGTGMVDDESAFLRVQAEVDRHHPTARLEAGEHRLEHLGAVVHQDGDMVAASDAQRGQGIRQLVDPLVKAGIRQLPRSMGRRQVVRKGAGRFGQQHADVHAEGVTRRARRPKSAAVPVAPTASASMVSSRDDPRAPAWDER